MPNFKKIIPILIGTSYLFFGCGNRTSSSSNNRSDIIDTVTFSAKLSKDIDSKNLSEDIAGGKLKIKGTYHGCFGKGDNSEWFLSEKKDNSNLIFKKNDVNCKIKLNKLEFNNDNNTEEYRINGEPIFISENYQINSIEFISSNNNGKKIYIKAKINPIDFSSVPTISVTVSEKYDYNFEGSIVKNEKVEILIIDKTHVKVIPFSGQYAMNLGVHIEGLSNGKEEIS
ncbi:MAG: hypothetical protein DCC88_01430 [Spirobacillus cienkowskii]|uniref:Lipoprotein n=1 Tax=Spirobacillus cienkowskii TaxID=495820 RepID=A0A369KTU1_9BACT|nr:MAG: hypothetical protein DCC88_01430 [Spirobacillus cienkowskii]